LADDNSDANQSRVGADSRDEYTPVDSAADGVVVDRASGAERRPNPEPHRARSRKVKPHRRWPWAIALVILTGLLTTSATMTYEMSQRSEEWSDQVDEAVQTSYGLGAQVAEATTENVQLGDQIDLLEEQLSNSKDTVLKLSDEKAQWRDDTEFAQQRVEATENLLTTAATVANGLQRCTDEQFELIGTLAKAEEYDPAELVAYQASVTELCDKAEKANVALQKALTE